MKHSNNCDRSHQSLSEWKQGAIVYTVGSNSYTLSNHPNGHHPYDIYVPTKQSPEVTKQMQRELEQQYKMKQLLKRVFRKA